MAGDSWAVIPLMSQAMRRHAETAVITAFFILTGVAPYGLSVDLTYPVIHRSLDLSLQYVGLLVALALVFSLRWTGIGRLARFLGRVATWCLFGVVVVQLCSAVVGILSGNGTLHFIVLWPVLNGHSPLGFLLVATMTGGYLYWQARTLGNTTIRMSAHAVV
jgi:hypothetical protein